MIAVNPPGATMRRLRLGRLLPSLVVGLALTLPGCATQSQRIGADDGSDVCHAERVRLDSTGDYFAKDILAGAAIGAVGGALIGGLAGGGRGALIGGLAGATLGAAGGYWHARQEQASSEQSLYQSVAGDIRNENSQITATQIAFNQLVSCRQNEAARIRADLKAGRITRSQAEFAMQAVRQRAGVDLQIAQSISGKIQERSQNFAFANDQVSQGQGPARSGAPAAPARRPSGAAAAPAAEVRRETTTNTLKRDQFNQSIARAQSNQSAFELT